MKKILKFLKKRIKVISFLSISFLILFVNINVASADYMDEEIIGNRKERQLLDKVDAIKKAFPNQIDREALYATMAHRGTFTDYTNEAYDPYFNEDSYEDQWSSLSQNIGNLLSNIGDSISALGDAILSGAECLLSGGTDEEGNEYETSCVLEKMVEKYIDRLNESEGEHISVADVKQPKSIDLLTAAAIVMLDSSGWTGTYSDENYKKALAGDQMVGNLFDKNNVFQNAASVIMNGVFCTIGGPEIFSMAFNPGVNFGDSREFGSQESVMLDRYSRYFTMSKICQNGFIGGTYDHVQNPDLSTEEGKERYQLKKDIVAEEIIELAKIFRGDEEELCVYYGATGAYSEWKQTDDRWSDVAIGSSNIWRIGCTTTSIAIQIARSGTKITNLPTGYTEFNPGALATSLSSNGGYSGNNITWSGYDNIAPNVKFLAPGNLNSSNEAVIAQRVTELLTTPVEGKYQPFVILKMYHNGRQHWVAVEGVQNNQVIINDPARKGKTLSENYSDESWHVEKYRIMYATDVPFGSSASSGGAQGGSYDDSCVTETSGDIIIPEEFGGGLKTVSEYDRISWAYNQKDVYDKWAAAGAQWDDGIAILDGRYLVACTKKFGNVGDKVDFFLEDGTKIPTIIADIKNENDAGCNEWGHNNGASVLEFEVQSYVFRHVYRDNVAVNGWHMEWTSRVASATNLGGNIL